jgi:hypothetical protein
MRLSELQEFLKSVKALHGDVKIYLEIKRPFFGRSTLEPAKKWEIEDGHLYLYGGGYREILYSPCDDEDEIWAFQEHCMR